VEVVFSERKVRDTNESQMSGGKNVNEENIVLDIPELSSSSAQPKYSTDGDHHEREQRS
jgi:hypothetical protein